MVAGRGQGCPHTHWYQLGGGKEQNGDTGDVWRQWGCHWCHLLAPVWGGGKGWGGDTGG